MIQKAKAFVPVELDAKRAGIKMSRSQIDAAGGVRACRRRPRIKVDLRRIAVE